MSLQPTIRLARASSLTIEIPDGPSVVVPPPSIQQARDCLLLDPLPDAPPETPRERTVRIVAQARILLGPQGDLVERLTPDQCVEVVQALYASACGIDPNDMLSVQRALAEGKQVLTALEGIQQLDDLVLELADAVRALPAAVAATPLADASALLERLRKSAMQEAKFDAALHGRSLR